MSDEKRYRIIYKICTDMCDDCYIGSTANLNVRIANHKQNSVKYMHQSKLYNTIREYGWDNWRVEKLHEELCSKLRCREIEDDYIKQLQPSLNTNGAVFNYENHKQKQKQKYHDNKQYKKDYYQKNKERIHQYYMDNREHFLEYQKNRKTTIALT